MGCPTEVEIGANLVFSVTSRDPDTGSMADTDAPPTYEVYEDETDTPILSGSMAKRNAKTGFYTESIACTLANGFENGKTYTVRIEGSIGAIDDSICFGFKAYDVRKVDVILVEGVTPEHTDDISDAVLEGIIEGSIQLKQAIQVILAYAAGKADGGGTVTLHFRDQADGKNRITLTVDADGNRSASVLSLD